MSNFLKDSINAIPEHDWQRRAMNRDLLKRIYAVLNEKRMFHFDLANALGITHKEICQWFNERHVFTFDEIARMNVALDTQLLDIGVKPNMPRMPEPSDDEDSLAEEGNGSSEDKIVPRVMMITACGLEEID